MNFKVKKCFLPGLGALALTIGASGNVLAITAGTLTNPKNDGIFPIYGDNTIDGYFGAQLYLLGSPTEMSIRYLGKEAGYTNTFNFDGSQIYSTADYPDNAWYSPPAAGPVVSILSGLLPFCFTTDSGADSVCNGANPDGSVGGAGVNWFVTFSNTTATSGTTVDLWLDDNGGGPDDNHDDMGIRLSIRGGEFGVVPIPASVWLFGSGLLGLVGIARRKKA